MIETIKCNSYREMYALLRKLQSQGLTYDTINVGYWWDIDNCTVFVRREEEVEDE